MPSALHKSRKERKATSSIREAVPAGQADRLEGLLRERYRLTPAEAHVARLVADGLKYAEMAEQLGVSYHTVHSHVKSLHVKMGVHSNGRLLARIRTDLL